jgi:hypothetical protein
VLNFGSQAPPPSAAPRLPPSLAGRLPGAPLVPFETVPLIPIFVIVRSGSSLLIGRPAASEPMGVFRQARGHVVARVEWGLQNEVMG